MILCGFISLKKNYVPKSTSVHFKEEESVVFPVIYAWTKIYNRDLGRGIVTWILKTAVLSR